MSKSNAGPDGRFSFIFELTGENIAQTGEPFKGPPVLRKTWVPPKKTWAVCYCIGVPVVGTRTDEVVPAEGATLPPFW